MNKVFLICLLLTVVVASVMCAPPECQSGETKQIECNTCRCINGRWGCSRKFCPSNVRTKRDTFCKPGSTFKQECNICRCNAYGTNAACTLKICL